MNSSRANSEDIPSESNFTLLVSALFAAGIFITVIVYFYCILFKDLTKKPEDNVATVDNYERLPISPEDEDEPQPSSSTSAHAPAINYGYVPEPSEVYQKIEVQPQAEAPSNSQTATVSIENVNVNSSTPNVL
jgi:hypothetical protein